MTILEEDEKGEGQESPHTQPADLPLVQDEDILSGSSPSQAQASCYHHCLLTTPARTAQSNY